MLPIGAILKPSDNSGAKKLKLIGIVGTKRSYAILGDIVTVAINGAS